MRPSAFTLALATGFALTAVVQVAWGAAAPPEVVSRRDPAAPFTAGMDDSSVPALSRDGRYVLFVSAASNLVTNDTNGALDVFLRDRTNATTVLVSANASGTASANGPSSFPALSADARFVVFESKASDLAPNDTNETTDLFLRDAAAGTTTLVSVNKDSTAPGNASSGRPQVSADGWYVAFGSTASDLVENDGNANGDVFVRDLLLGTNVLASVNWAGTNTANGWSGSPAISPDGRYVVFESYAADLVTNDVGATLDIFLRDLALGQTTLVSVGTNNLAAGQCENPAMSAEGRYVAFESTARTLVGGSVQTLGSVYWRDVQAGVTKLVSGVGADPFFRTNSANSPVITTDGSQVAFTAGPNGVKTLGFSRRIYVWDALPDAVRLVTVASDGVTPANGDSHSPEISDDHRYITFLSNATNLVANVTNGAYQVYQRDLVAGVTTLVSVTRDGRGHTSGDPAASTSADGRWVAFHSVDGNLVADDDNEAYDVFVRDLSAPSTELVSRAHPSAISTTPSGPSSVSPKPVSADNRFVVFTSPAGNLAAGDTNGTYDVFVRDRTARTNLLISVNTNGLPGNTASHDAVLSADGRYVAFLSQATDLAPNVTNRTDNVYLRDLQIGTTTLISATASSFGSTSPAAGLSISVDGRVLAYQSLANDLVPGISFTRRFLNVFAYDRLAGTNRLVSLNRTGVGGNGNSTSPVVSPDGNKVLFASAASDLMPTSLPGSPPRVFVRDLPTGTLTVVTDDAGRGSISPGAQVFSADSQRVAFAGGTNGLVCDLPTARRTALIGGGTNLAISGNGRFVALEKLPTTDPPHTNWDIVVVDTVTGGQMLASLNRDGTGGGNGPSRSPALSQDGRYVVFRSRATDLVAAPVSGVGDVFVRDLLTAQTTLLSLSRAGATAGNALSSKPCLGPDGRTVLFESFASDLLTADLNQTKDVFLLHLSTPDSDGDGMDDDWEVTYFGNLSRDGKGDADEDGIGDLDEFKAGTNPVNDGSVLRVITLESLLTGATTVYWNAVAGRTYVVQYKDDLATDWTNLPASVTSGSTTASTQDPTAPAAAQRFYRVLLVSP